MKITTEFHSETKSQKIYIDLRKVLKLGKEWEIDDITPTKEGDNYTIEVMASRSL